MYRKTVIILLCMWLGYCVACAEDGHKHGAACSGGHKKEHDESKHDEDHKEDHDVDHKDEHKDHDEGHKEDHDEDHDHNHKDHDDEDGHSEEEHEEEGLIHLTPEQKKNINLEISTAKMGGLDSKIFLPGEIKYNRDRMAQIMPQMPGFVSKVYKKAGEKIKSGEKLATLQSHKLGELHAEYRSAKELELLAKTEFEIRLKLWKKKAVSEREYIQARQAYAESLVNRHRAEDKLKSLGLKPEDKNHNSHDKNSSCTNYHLKSPIGGVVISKDITLGENYPEDNSKIPFTVADLSKLWGDFSARQHHLPKLKKGMPVVIQLGEGFPDFKGKIKFIAPSFDAETRTVLVRVILDNSKGVLKPGLFATGIISVSSPKSKKIVIPRSAMLMIEGEAVVFLQKGKAYEAKQVQPGNSSGGFVEIISGLKLGDKYVSKGAFELKALMVTSGMDPHAGHGH